MGSSRCICNLHHFFALNRSGTSFVLQLPCDAQPLHIPPQLPMPLRRSETIFQMHRAHKTRIIPRTITSIICLLLSYLALPVPLSAASSCRSCVSRCSGFLKKPMTMRIPITNKIARMTKIIISAWLIGTLIFILFYFPKKDPQTSRLQVLLLFCDVGAKSKSLGSQQIPRSAYAFAFLFGSLRNSRYRTATSKAPATTVAALKATSPMATPTS